LANLICFQALASVVDGNLQKQIQPLHGIVFCLVRLDLWTLMAAIKVSDGSSHNLHPSEYEDIEKLLLGLARNTMLDYIHRRKRL
jgi:hypothetical protein